MNHEEVLYLKDCNDLHECFIHLCNCAKAQETHTVQPAPCLHVLGVLACCQCLPWIGCLECWLLEYKVSTCQHSMLRKQIYLSFGCLMPLRLPKTGDDSAYLTRDLSRIYTSHHLQKIHKTWIHWLFVCGGRTVGVIWLPVLFIVSLPSQGTWWVGWDGECCGHLLINQPKGGTQREGRKDEPEVKPTTWFRINGAGKNEKNDWHWKEVYGNKRVGIDWCLFQRSFDIHPWKALLVGFCWLLLIVCTTRDLLNIL